MFQTVDMTLSPGTSSRAPIICSGTGFTMGLSEKKILISKGKAAAWLGQTKEKCFKLNPCFDASRCSS